MKSTDRVFIGFLFAIVLIAQGAFTLVLIDAIEFYTDRIRNVRCF